MEDMMFLRIKKRRKELNLSLKELSSLSGISASALQRYETKGTDMAITKLVQIANALETTPLYLMGMESKDLSWDEIRCILPLIEQFSFKLDYDGDSESYILKSINDNTSFPIALEDLRELKKNTLSYFEFLFMKTINKSTP